MWSNRCVQLAIRRFLLMGLLRAACLSLLPTFAWTQGLLPCHPQIQTWTVANTNDTATLASMLNCSNGSFAVEWFGDVVVSQTIYITQVTSLNITGASTGATADGNHTTQLFAVDGASSLHITDMVLTNGDAVAGGAIFGVDQSSISFRGNMTFASNAAWYGGAIYTDSSTTVFWDGEETSFMNNYASYHGGAIMTERSSDISWDGVTAFVNNSADNAGGAILVLTSSKISWIGKTTFVENTAFTGGAIRADLSTVVWDGNETTFSNNYASLSGGALAVSYSSSGSWYGETVFSNNSAGSWGGAIHVHSSSVVWGGGVAMFSNNHASLVGGALSAENSSSVSWGGETVFVNNNAESAGGAVYVVNYSNVSWKDETVFMNNSAEGLGGGACIITNSNVFWTGNTTFQNNSAIGGGGLIIAENSVGAWSGTTMFARNTATSFGGGIDVLTGSNVSWAGTTTFLSNIADTAGAMVVLQSDISWTGNTVFADNIASTDGGAVYVSLSSRLGCQGTTTFRNNTAKSRNGGALGIYGYVADEGPTVNISGETTFTNNSAYANGGAIFSSANPRGQYYEGVTFRSNSANVGGAVATFGTGNGNELDEFPTKFWRCQFISNTATETGGAVESAFGREEFVSTHFDSNFAELGGALNLGGVTTISECSFVSNLASNTGLAVAAVGSLEINGSFFRGNAFFCEEGKFLEERPQELSSTVRYDSVCRGCPPWNECHSCTVSDSNYNPICSIAMEHTTAAEPGTTLETLSVDSGYWRATTESSTILACYNTGSCLGGQTGEDSFCDEGYMGPYCSVCRSGYSSSLSTTCRRCSPSRRRWFVAMAVIVGIVAVCAIAAFSGYLMSTNFEERERASVYHRILRKAPIQAFKSVIVVWQILTQFASVANVTYPGVYQTFLSSLTIINLDIGFVMSAGCLWLGIDFHDRLITDTIWPLAALGIMGRTYTIALRRNSGSDDSIREKIRNKHLSAVLFLLFFVYSSVSSTVFRMFACDLLDDGEEYLRADYRIICTDAKHRALQVYAAIMIAVYPVGIPLLFVVLLYRHRDVLSTFGADKPTAQSISSLWAPYRPSCFYYEVVECGRRIMLTGVVVFTYPNSTAQIAITVINSFFFFVVSEALSPYASVSDTWLSRFGHVLVYFSVFDVLLLKVDASQESSGSQQILAGVFVTGHVVMVVAVVAEAIGICYAARRVGDDVVEEPNPFQSALRLRPVTSSGPWERKGEINTQAPSATWSWSSFMRRVESWEGNTEEYRRAI